MTKHKPLKEKVQSAKEDKELVRSSIERKLLDIVAYDKKYTKYSGLWHIQKSSSHALSRLKQLEALSKKEVQEKPLFGLSYSLKDIFCTKDIPTTCASEILKDYLSPFDSSVHTRLMQDGAVLVCKTAMDEFAMGSSTSSSTMGWASVAHDSSKSAGGSSGGAATSLAAGLCDFSVGSDTGGSVRQPASYQGLVGFKPTWGSVSRWGQISYASSLDQAGFMTVSLEDMRYLISESGIFTQDCFDMTCQGVKKDSFFKLPEQIKVGFFPFLLETADISDCVKQAYEKTIKSYYHQGAKLCPIDLSSISMSKYTAQIYYASALPEAFSCLARYQGVSDEKLAQWSQQDSSLQGLGYFKLVAKYRSQKLGWEVKKRILLGSYILGLDDDKKIYQNAKSARFLLQQQMRALFSQVDVLCLPTTTSTAKSWEQVRLDKSKKQYMDDFLTAIFSLCQMPAISLDSGFGQESASIGVQLAADKFEDLKLLEIARVLGHQ